MQLSDDVCAEISQISKDKRYSLSKGSYKFGKGNASVLQSLDAAKWLCNKLGIHQDLGVDALAYLDECVILNQKNREEKENNRPTVEDWQEGDLYPEWLSPIQFTTLLFSLLDVTPSGTWMYKKKVPKWIKTINRSVKSGEQVKQYDINAGITEALRNWRRKQTDDEKKASLSITSDQIKECIPSVQSKMRKGTLRKIGLDVKFDDTVGDSELKSFLRLYKAKGDINHHTTMLKHWVWNVKRRLYGKSTRFETCVLFLGRQGIGKSYIGEKLNQAFQNFLTYATVKDIEDTRETPRWENYRIAFFDEMSKESKESLAKLKFWVTASTITYRPMKTNTDEVCDKNAQGIGTTNFPVAHILKDASGMRRFWEIPSDQPKNVIFKGMDEVDWIEIFQSVDEDKDEGYFGPGLKYYEEITEVQDNSRDKTPVEEYLYYYNLVDHEGTTHPDVSTRKFMIKELRDNFKDWCEDQGWGKYNIKSFKNELVNLGLHVSKGRANATYVTLNDPVQFEAWHEGKKTKESFSGDLFTYTTEFDNKMEELKDVD